MNRLLGLSCVAILGLALRGSAQTISYGNPSYMHEDLSITLPKMRWDEKPDYPEELEHTHEIGYAIVQESLSEKAKVIFQEPVANAVVIERLLGSSNVGWSFKPAVKDGVGVPITIWFSVIFNPKPAPGPGFEVGPQLVHVTPLEAPRTKSTPAKAIIETRFSIDETGQVTAAEPTEPQDEHVIGAINRWTRRWKFMPALLGGKPVACQITMPVVIHYVGRAPAGRFVGPVAIYKEHPIYPPAMALSGIKGEVLVDFVVTTKGTVIGAWAARSNAPWFESAAITAVRNWTFKPATLDGVPVRYHLQAPIIFTVGEGFNGGSSAYQVSGGSHNKGEFPIEMTGVIIPVYPYADALAKNLGTAKVRISVAEDGRPEGVSILSASSPEYGLALAAAAWGFNFTPAYKDGKPLEAAVIFEQKFGSEEMVDDDLWHAISVETKHPDQIRSAKQLDAPLTPLSIRPAIAPRGLKEIRTVSVSFLVDVNGKVELPRSDDPAPDIFTYAAIQAVSRWLFEPPTAGGKPVYTRAKVPVVFKPALEKPAS